MFSNAMWFFCSIFKLEVRSYVLKSFKLSLLELLWNRYGFKRLNVLKLIKAVQSILKLMMQINIRFLTDNSWINIFGYTTQYISFGSIRAWFEQEVSNIYKQEMGKKTIENMT